MATHENMSTNAIKQY